MRNIPKVLLWLAGVIFCAHMFIPHDHHLPDASGKENECHQHTKLPSGHKSGLPLHCHALNDLAAEKATKYFISGKVTQNHPAFVETADCLSCLAGVITIVGLVGQQPRCDINFNPSSPLRAPPGKI